VVIGHFHADGAHVGIDNVATAIEVLDSPRASRSRAKVVEMNTMHLLLFATYTAHHCDCSLQGLFRSTSAQTLSGVVHRNRDKHIQNPRVGAANSFNSAAVHCAHSVSIHFCIVYLIVVDLQVPPIDTVHLQNHRRQSTQVQIPKYCT